MPLERINTGEEPSDELMFTGRQMAEAINERDRYRQALYDATSARLATVEKDSALLADWGKTIDALHRELHAVCKERDTALHELGRADDILDSPLRTVRFAASVVVQVAREKARGRARRFVTHHTPRVTPREPRRKRMGVR